MQVKFGAEYIFPTGYQIRAGYAYIETPVPDHTLEPGNPDSDQNNFALGVGVTKGKWQIDAFYDIELYEDRSVSNGFQEGEYTNMSHYLGFSVGYIF